MNRLCSARGTKGGQCWGVACEGTDVCSTHGGKDVDWDAAAAEVRALAAGRSYTAPVAASPVSLVDRRRRCDVCGAVMNLGSLGGHQKSSGHKGFSDVALADA